MEEKEERQGETEKREEERTIVKTKRSLPRFFFFFFLLTSQSIKNPLGFNHLSDLSKILKISKTGTFRFFPVSEI